MAAEGRTRETRQGAAAARICTVASRYDDELWKLVPADPGPPPAHLVAFVRGLGHADRALDLGCGDGRLSAALDTGNLTAADVSAVALDRARSRLPAARFVELDSDVPLPLDDAGFDLVLCAETIEHVRDVQLLLSEIRRVLRPGGTLALTTPANLPLGPRPDPLSPHLRQFTRRSLSRVLDDLGFEVESLRRRSGTLLAVARRP
jgi:ubiquinone/menaquinone biosynthesis C-methylase UbiE